MARMASPSGHLPDDVPKHLTGQGSGTLGCLGSSGLAAWQRYAGGFEMSGIVSDPWILRWPEGLSLERLWNPKMGLL